MRAVRSRVRSPDRSIFASPTPVIASSAVTSTPRRSTSLSPTPSLSDRFVGHVGRDLHRSTCSRSCRSSGPTRDVGLADVEHAPRPLDAVLHFGLPRRRARTRTSPSSAVVELGSPAASLSTPTPIADRRVERLGPAERDLRSSRWRRSPTVPPACRPASRAGTPSNPASRPPASPPPRPVLTFS